MKVTDESASRDNKHDQALMVFIMTHSSNNNKALPRFLSKYPQRSHSIPKIHITAQILSLFRERHCLDLECYCEEGGIERDGKQGNSVI